jgi:hypothetical protein
MACSNVALLLLLSFPTQLFATERCTPIDQPDEDYRSATTRCSLGRPWDQTDSCKDESGSKVAAFDIRLSVRTCIEWSCWSVPPESESTGYAVFGFTGVDQSTLMVNLRDLAAIAGMEIQPNRFDVVPIVASFRANEGEELLRIERMVDGLAGARLFAVRCDEPVIASVVIEAPPEALGFAIAFLRSDAFRSLPGG